MVISALCFEASVDLSLEYLFRYMQWIPQICLSFYLKYLEDISGGSRISARWTRHSSRGVPTDDFAKLSTELDGIERIWTPRGDRMLKILLCRSATAHQSFLWSH